MAAADLDEERGRAGPPTRPTLAYEPSAAGENKLKERRRPKHLFVGLAKCGCCGGGYAMISKDLLGCATANYESDDPDMLADVALATDCVPQPALIQENER